MYYGIITLCSLMFSSQFLFSRVFSKEYGNDLQATFVLGIGNGLIGIIALSLINRFSFGCTPFALIMALICTLDAIILSFLSLKALGKINLSLYSMYMMLGGMLLPSAAGILFFDEALMLSKCLCFLCIIFALLLTVQKGEKKSGTLYYAGIFILNGLSGVISKIYQAAPFEKVSASEYSILCAALGLVLSVILLLIFKSDNRRLNLKSVFAMFGGGALNRIANWLSLICLSYLPASVQSPFITGATIIFSMIIGLFLHQRPDKREVASVMIALVGLFILVFIK